MRKKIFITIAFCLAIHPAWSQNSMIPPQLSSLESSTDLNYLSFLDKGLLPSGLNTYRVGNGIEVLGDINGDGYDDWGVSLIGAGDYYSNDIPGGAIHIYFGGTSKRTSETKADMVIRGTYPDFPVGLDIQKAGDVNNDGFDDMLVRSVSAWYLYYGGDPFDSEPDLSFEKLEIHGGVLSTAFYAGDLNGDGYDDISIGVPTRVMAPDTAHAYVYFGGDPMDNVPDRIIDGGWVSIPDFVGATNFNLPQYAGDMNNDGYDDLIISSSFGGELFLGGEDMDYERDALFENFLGGGAGAGPIPYAGGDLNNDGFDDLVLVVNVGLSKAIVFYGGETIDTVPDVDIPSIGEEAWYGTSLTSIGDIDNDGFDDLLLGILTTAWIDTTEVKIFYGGNPMDSIADVTILSQGLGQSFGFTVKGNADFDGDGKPDFLVGNNGILPTISLHDNAGDVSLFYGDQEDLSEPHARFSGVGDGEGFGFKTAFAGDVNNDGYFDRVIAAPNYINPKTGRYRGKAYLYLGGENLDNVPDLEFTSPDSIIDVLFGKEVVPLGDVNGDTYSDIGIRENRRFHIFYGGASMDTVPDYTFQNLYPNADKFIPVGDINNDGFDDVLIGKPNTGIGGTVSLYTGSAAGLVYATVYAGQNSQIKIGYNMAGAGDLNGDAYPDFVIASPGTSSTGVSRGQVWVYFGGVEVPQEPGLILEGTADNQNLGSGAIGAGEDINNDSYNDLVLGERYFSLTPNSREGRLIFFYGGQEMDSIADLTIQGVDLNDQLGKNVMLLPDLNGDNYAEIMANKGILSGPNGEKAVIYFGGSPHDTIADVSMDFMFGQQDFKAYYDEASAGTHFMVGDYSNVGPGPSAGRVHLFTTLDIVIPLLEVSTTTIVFDHTADGEETIQVSSNTDWSVETNAGWLDIQPLSGTGDGSITVSPNSPNTSESEDRTATITVSVATLGPETVSVRQTTINNISTANSQIRRLYPNPASAEVTMEFFQYTDGSSALDIYNTSGMLVSSARLPHIKAGNQQYTVDLNELPEGVYYFTLETPDAVMNGKFMVRGKD